MNLQANDIDRLKLTTQFAWFLTFFTLIIGYPFLQAVIVFILTKLYEFFIQQNVIKF